MSAANWRKTCWQGAVSGTPASRTPIETLSDRELEAFELIGHGQTTESIAGKMHVSPKTVETYRARIKEKLGLRNHTELIQRGAVGAGNPIAREKIRIRSRQPEGNALRSTANVSPTAGPSPGVTTPGLFLCILRAQRDFAVLLLRPSVPS